MRAKPKHLFNKEFVSMNERMHCYKICLSEKPFRNHYITQFVQNMKNAMFYIEIVDKEFKL